ncbi:MAG: C39 family peptidase [Candidatus Woesearchaeota archaeon]|nr:MAG: C39 family peptidase [Candidatus Woesearchaeota archaeon]
MKIPYYKQEKDYTCGPAVMRMLLAAKGIKKSEKELERMLKISTRIGTWFKYFPIVAEKYRLDYVVARNSNLKELKKLLKEGYIIMVGYFMEEENVGHYAVVTKVDSKYVYMLDPYLGPNRKLRIMNFLKNWYDEAEKEKRWLFGIR